MHISIGEHLREERRRQGLTVQEVASLCGTSRSYITLIENNKRLPGRKVLPKIANALNVKTVVVLNWYLEDIALKIHKDLEMVA